MLRLEITEFFIAPFYLALILGLGYVLRPTFTNQYTKPYFIPALAAKLIGAIALGILYHTLYGGDTNLYFKYASLIYEAFGKSVATGLHLIFTDGTMTPDIAPYASQIPWFGPVSNEYPVIRIAAIFNLLSFDTYLGTAMFFAAYSFSGMWAMYMTFAKIRPAAYKQLAIAVFFLPSVFFWGSGLLKDSLCIGSLGWLFYAFYRGAIEKKNIVRSLVIGLLAARIIASMKVYILLAFIPPAALWIFNENTSQITSPLLRWVARPLLLSVGMAVAAYAISAISAADNRLKLENIGEQSKRSSENLQGTAGTDQGSGYNLGVQDGTLGGMARLAPQAVAVALFRPFIWEAHNITMLLSALEASYFIFLTLRILLRAGPLGAIRAISSSPILVLCFVFSLVFAMSVGLSSGNFGTLVRYKIPLMPFYLAGLYIMESIVTESAGRRGARPGATRRPRLATA